jgi:hypothetical protein
MAADPKMVILPYPGNAFRDPDFFSMDRGPAPDESNNGNIGWDDDYAGKPPKTLTGPVPWKNLRTGRK